MTSAGEVTVTLTALAVLLSDPSFTTREKVSVILGSPIFSVGAVKFGCCAVLLLSVTDVPPV